MHLLQARVSPRACSCGYRIARGEQRSPRGSVAPHHCFGKAVGSQPDRWKGLQSRVLIATGLVAIYWVSCFVVMTRVLRDQSAPMAIAGASSQVALVWLEAFVW